MFTEKVSLTVFVSTCISFSRDDGALSIDRCASAVPKATTVSLAAASKATVFTCGFLGGGFACPWSPVNIYRLTLKQGDYSHVYQVLIFSSQVFPWGICVSKKSQEFP